VGYFSRRVPSSLSRSVRTIRFTHRPLPRLRCPLEQELPTALAKQASMEPMVYRAIAKFLRSGEQRFADCHDFPVCLPHDNLSPRDTLQLSTDGQISKRSCGQSILKIHLRSPRRGVFTITDRGKSVLAKNSGQDRPQTLGAVSGILGVQTRPLDIRVPTPQDLLELGALNVAGFDVLLITGKLRRSVLE
jgi:hypothetical protein